jgi:hypothetical protein
VWYFFPNKHVYFQINSVYFQNKQRKTLTLTHPIGERKKNRILFSAAVSRKLRENL